MIVQSGYGNLKGFSKLLPQYSSCHVTQGRQAYKMADVHVKLLVIPSHI